MAGVLNRRLILVTTDICKNQARRQLHSQNVVKKPNREVFRLSKDLKLCQAWMRYASTSSDNIVKSPVPDIAILEDTIPEYVWKNVNKWSNHKALTCGVTGRSYTYSQARDLSRRFAKALLKSGLKPGDVLAIMLPNIPEYPLILLGALEAGILVSTVNPIYTKHEILHQLKTSGTKCMVTLPSLLPTVKEVAARLGSAMPIITVSCDEGRGGGGGSWDFGDMVKTDLDVDVKKASGADDVACLPFSSGTTGLSKGVALTHRNIVTNIEQILAEPVNHLMDTTSEHQDVLPTVLPFFHIYALTTSMFRGLARGLHVVTVPKFDPQVYLKILTDQKPQTCVCYCAPPLILFFGSHPIVTTEILKAVRVTVNGAGPVGIGDIERLLNKVPNRKEFIFINAYGLTETSPVVFAPIFREEFELISVGVPMPNTRIRVVDTSGKNLGPREHGEILVNGPQVMKGYHKNEEATANAFDGEWFKTGDVGYYDEKKNFYIVERLKELIKVKGFQVPPAELEAVLRSHPNVLDAGVIGVPDERTGEKPVAFLVPKPGAQIEIDQVKEFVAEQVAPYKQLGGVIVTDAIPKNPSGKILRRLLKEQYSKGQ